MSIINAEEIDHLAALCRIDCTEKERESLLHDLEKILNYVEQLKNVDTENVKACKNVLGPKHQAIRADRVGELLDRKLFLENAADSQEGSVRVPAIITSK